MHRFSIYLAIFVNSDNFEFEYSYLNVIIRTEANEFCFNFDNSYFHIATPNDG